MVIFIYLEALSALLIIKVLSPGLSLCILLALLMNADRRFSVMRTADEHVLRIMIFKLKVR